MKQYYIGLDLGKRSDYTAIAILKRIEAETTRTRTQPGEPKPRPRYLCVALDRYRDVDYPLIVEQVRDILNSEAIRDKTDLAIDASGVGLPVCDMFTHARISHTGVIITGGDKVNRDGCIYRVPKRHLVSTLQVLLSSNRLDIAAHPLRSTVMDELNNFQVKVTEAANDRYEGRDGEHDDMVLAIALAAWRAESNSGAGGRVSYDSRFKVDSRGTLRPANSFLASL